MKFKPNRLLKTNVSYLKCKGSICYCHCQLIHVLLIVKSSFNCVFGEYNLHFQQDGVPPHYDLAVRECLSKQFPDTCIDRRGARNGSHGR